MYCVCFKPQLVLVNNARVGEVVWEWVKISGPCVLINRGMSPPRARVIAQVDTTEHRRLALSVAEQAMTLLKNSGPAPLLPIRAGAKIALLGPQANFTQEMLSNYEGQNKLVDAHSPLMARLALNLFESPHSL